MSSLIVLGIVAIWILVLVPMWLNRHDADNASRSMDTFSTAMRVLSRRAPGARRPPLSRHATRRLGVTVDNQPDPSPAADGLVRRRSAGAPAATAQPSAAVERPRPVARRAGAGSRWSSPSSPSVSRSRPWSCTRRGGSSSAPVSRSPATWFTCATKRSGLREMRRRRLVRTARRGRCSDVAADGRS